MNKEYSFRVTVSPNRKEMGIAAGKCGEKLLCEALKEKETIRVIMASAPSQDDVLDYLRNSKKIDWSRVEIFHMDEYIGVSPDDKVSFSNYLQRTIVDAVSPKCFHKIVTNTKPAQAVADEYSKLIDEDVIDVVFLGIGENGHIAFNDPIMADLKDPKTMKVVELDEICRTQQVHDGCFPTLNDVPKEALSLTVPALMRGAHLVCTVPTSKKNNACLNVIFGKVGAACPASAMRLHPDCNLFLDSESGFGLDTLEGVETTL